MNLGAMFPFAILVSSLILGVSMMALGAAIVLRPTPPIIERIETRTVVLIEPGQTKREVLKLLGGPK